MGTNRKTIYPPPLVMPTPTVSDKDKEPYVNVKTFGDVGQGEDGPLLVTADIVVNKYAGLDGDFMAGVNTLIVDSQSDAADFTIGQEIIILQTQIFRTGDLGKYEYCTIQDISGSQIVLSKGLEYNYYSDSDGNKQNNTKSQIISVPHFSDVEIQAGFNIKGDAWDGYKGGIISFKCSGTLHGAGNISAYAIGYRSWTGVNFTSGEGYMGTGNHTTAENFGGGGHVPGGYAGGGHANVGAAVGGSPPGRAFGTNDLLNELTFGGGGNGYSSPKLGAGGIITISCAAITLTGTIAANGWGGPTEEGSCAGGSVLILGSDASTATVQALAGSAARAPGSDGFTLNSLSPAPQYAIKYRVPPTPEIPVLPKPSDNPNVQAGAAYALVAADGVGNKTIYMTNTSANIVNVDLDATEDIPIDSLIPVTQEGLGATTIQAATGVTINGIDGGSYTLSAQHNTVFLIKRAANTWLLREWNGVAIVAPVVEPSYTVAGAGTAEVNGNYELTPLTSPMTGAKRVWIKPGSTNVISVYNSKWMISRMDPDAGGAQITCPAYTGGSWFFKIYPANRSTGVATMLNGKYQFEFDMDGTKCFWTGTRWEIWNAGDTVMYDYSDVDSFWPPADPADWNSGTTSIDYTDRYLGYGTEEFYTVGDGTEDDPPTAGWAVYDGAANAPTVSLN